MFETENNDLMVQQEFDLFKVKKNKKENILRFVKKLGKLAGVGLLSTERMQGLWLGRAGLGWKGLLMDGVQ